MSDDRASQPAETSGNESEYMVVARRYRPQSFNDLVGQQQVTQALQNAIETNRVGHAYLFTGARGVGKTSAARILSKCLNCVKGPAAAPCNECDICEAIAAGSDVDVLEIDGASNRGIDEIRQLRSNVGIRPGRARFKIYIIDEVHMLTKEAFNALLKTLEEPPEHVKFVFCTTDPEKIPITVLSRCQRFDFAPIASESIVRRLKEIVAAEGATADEEALELLARRAGGSMRDSQSMLEQIISFSGDAITVDALHGMLGTARSHRLSAIMDALYRQDAAVALGELDAAVLEGVDVGQLAEQLLGYFRDAMSAGVGCEPTLMRHSSAAEFPRLRELGSEWGVATILAASQIMDQAIARMRQSLQRRTLVELALVRISHLGRLDDLATLLAQLKSGNVALPAPRPADRKLTTSAISQPDSASSTTEVKKKRTDGSTTDDVAGANSDEPFGGVREGALSAAPVVPISGQAAAKSHNEPTEASSADQNGAATSSTAAPGIPLTKDNATQIWERSLTKVDGLTGDAAREYESIRLDGDHHLTVTLSSQYHANRCRRPDHKEVIEAALSSIVGQTVKFSVEVQERKQAVNKTVARRSQAELIRESYDHPFVRRAMDLFGADVVSVQEKRTSK